MATKNINATLNMMDGGGNLNVVYLVTKKENITDLTVMAGASSSAAGKTGLVPAPAAGKQTSFLRGDGTWVIPTNTTYSNATTSKAGLMSAADKSRLDALPNTYISAAQPSALKAGDLWIQPVE